MELLINARVLKSSSRGVYACPLYQYQIKIWTIRKNEEKPSEQGKQQQENKMKIKKIEKKKILICCQGRGACYLTKNHSNFSWKTNETNAWLEIHSMF